MKHFVHIHALVRFAPAQNGNVPPPDDAVVAAKSPANSEAESCSPVEKIEPAIGDPDAVIERSGIPTSLAGQVVYVVDANSLIFQVFHAIPEMTSPSGAESPSPVGPFLVWQQPHPIYYAELAYRQNPERATLEKYRDVVFATAEFMASYAAWDAGSDSFVLGPVLQCAQERFPKTATLNPTFELTYWRWGLETAQKWRERLGMSRDPEWDRVLEKLAKPLVVDGKYALSRVRPTRCRETATSTARGYDAGTT